ncbi:hypothetical protein GIB67_019129 [Kingdonia uniflora]|uniref:Protein kinase domain-containing protein n=1 Tax=Kingdonia uniflora TaxID=39325 RepID=A0A7J7N010_9MAGN|nr:hypothetical protein GIB67_019129 [Kingdonia uniflora]
MEKHSEVKLLLMLLVIVFASSLFLPVVASLADDEGKALMSIKESFSNVANALLDWDNLRNEDHCAWRGVSCDNLNFSVVALNLSNLNLGGEISPSIGVLKYIQSIDLKGNHLTGQIPDEIGNCASLKILDLSTNSIYGDIPFSISKLKQLEDLNLKNNQLVGPIPSTLSQIPNLKTLGLRGNSLTGSLSPDMCQLTGLWYFDVRGNNLTGGIPDNIGNCTSFEILDISYNQISGEIPYNIGFLQVATLSLQGNKLSGKIPEVIGLMQALAVLDLSENKLVGPIPPILGNLSYTGKLYLQGNNLTGPIPTELGNMTKLSYLSLILSMLRQLNDNQLVGGIPPELGNLEELFELNLANNYLEGPIPQNISSCTALNQLNVFGNRLNGSIPSTFQSLGSLTYLNLSSNNFKGRIPVELGRIINLDTLDLSSNEFSGTIPASIGGLEHLLTLNLTRNQLNGPLSVEFGNLRSIQIIDLSFNELSGKIPEELGHLQNIYSLILRNNNIHGPIPVELSDCFSLITLDLSFNNLSGAVPPTKIFSRFPPESFVGNPLLCGDWLGSLCRTYATEPKGPPKLVVLQMDLKGYTCEDIMRISENLNEKYIVGYGASSTVYKCVLKNSKAIAIKRLYTQYPHNLREFQSEYDTVGSIRHRNLVSLLGFSLSPNGNLLFYDYMPNGSLWDLLHGPAKKVKLDWDTRLRIAVGAAQGLAYLHHDCNPRIIHRDVKTSNILVDDNFEARLSDFGIAKCISPSKTHANTSVLGTIGYIDPEYARTSRLTEKSDVYSFGIVLLELLTGKKAVDNESNLLQMILSKAGDNTVMEAVDPEVSVTCMDLSLVKKTFQLALLCTKRYSSERPSMQEVAHVLVSLLPAAPKKLGTVPLPVNYTQFVTKKEERQQQQSQNDDSSNDAQWFVKFGEVISKNSL